MTWQELKGWLGVAVVTPAIATSWAIGGDILKNDLTPHAKPKVGVVSPQQPRRPTATLGEQIFGLQELSDARRRGVITQDEFLAEKQKVVAEPLGR